MNEAVTDNIDVIVLDFDGVIIDSVEVKTRAFAELFANLGPEAVEYVVDYHQRHGGVSRFVKFRHFYDKLLGREISKSEMQELNRRFNEIALEKLEQSPLMPGARDFLENNDGRPPLYVASGAPQEELEFLTERLGIQRHFRKIFGSPPPKAENLARIIEETGAGPQRVIMIGDSSTDLEAAEANGTLFLGVGRFPEPHHWITDLRELEQALADKRYGPARADSRSRR